MSEIKAIISDLDGTLVDTFEANFQAYRSVLAAYDLVLTREVYRRHFGLRLTEFLTALGLSVAPSVVAEIRKAKSKCYPDFFDALKPNRVLLEFLRAFKAQSGRIALVTTASRANVDRVVHHIGADGLFELIISGEDVVHGKPDPECYITACRRLMLASDEVLVFEDTQLGLDAAHRAGIKTFRIQEAFYET